MHAVLLGGAALLVVMAAVVDLKTREIPDWISITLVGLAVIAYLGGWSGLSLIGMLGGGVIGFFVSGALQLGGGDVKLLAALGMLLSPWGWLQATLWIILCGGVLAAIALIRHQKEYAYAPAIAVGFLINLTGCCPLIS